MRVSAAPLHYRNEDLIVKHLQGMCCPENTKVENVAKALFFFLFFFKLHWALFIVEKVFDDKNTKKKCLKVEQ